MFDRKTRETPLSFEEVKAAEREAIYSTKRAVKDPGQLSALCLSGGGIRSATFALGVLQGLAEKDALQSFDYLSTVSGGGYIGGWLTAWTQRQGGLDRIISALRPGATFSQVNSPNPVQHLREYNNYLSPRLGLLSADTWTLVATVGRNILLNWLVLVPLLMSALMVPRLILSLARWGEAIQTTTGSLWAHKIEIEYVIGTVACMVFVMATCNTLRYLPGVGNANRSEASFLKYCLAPMIGAALGFITLESWFTGGDKTAPTSLTFSGLFVAITACCIVGCLAYILFNVRKMRQQYGLLIGLVLALVVTSLSTAFCAWFLVSRLAPQMEWETYVTFAPPLLLLAFALPVVLFVGWTSNILNDEDREWLSRAGAWMLLFFLLWTGTCSVVLLAPSWAFDFDSWGRSTLVVLGSAGGILTAWGGFSPKSKARRPDRRQSQQDTARGRSRLLGVALLLAAGIFMVIFAVALTMLTNWALSVTRLVPGDWTDHWQFLEDTKTRWAVAAALTFLLFAIVMAKFIDVNKFSLHAMYRDRLIRAYLGASNRREHVDKFTGFAKDDDLEMSKLRPELRPLHVINVTLNLVAGERLAWQQRKAQAFTISALHCGSSRLGYRKSEEYGGGMSLGTAMTLSGAAASPNMGYYSSPVIGLIMTLFNARLGAWLGNPGVHGNSTWRNQGPRSAIASIMREALGLTTEESPYVYLSDGGHFENLGLYEMVMRECRYIMVVDGTADGNLSFGDLGNALRKIRIDTNIDIQFGQELADQLRKRKTRYALATIGYKAAGRGEDGVLIYVKPMLLETDPPDLISYAANNSDFPHQTTANQFFNESQTESYRMLGLQTVREMLAGWEPRGLQTMVDHLRVTLGGGQPLAATAEAGG